MKKWIIPVCLAYMMLFSTCKRDTGGDNGVADPDKGFDYGKNSYTQAQSSGNREGSQEGSPGKRKATHFAVMPERIGKEDKTGTTVITGSKKTVKIRRNAAVDSVLSDADKGTEAGGSAGQAACRCAGC